MLMFLWAVGRVKGEVEFRCDGGGEAKRGMLHSGGPFQPFTIYLGEDQMLFRGRLTNMKPDF